MAKAKAIKPPKGADTGPVRKQSPILRRGGKTKGGEIFGKPKVNTRTKKSY